jgi:hypothetical protein
MMDPIMTTLIQQEQQRDRLKEMEQDQLARIAGLSQPGLGKLLSPITAWLGQQMVAWGLKLQPSIPSPTQCCVQCGPQECNTVCL